MRDRVRVRFRVAVAVLLSGGVALAACGGSGTSVAVRSSTSRQAPTTSTTVSTTSTSTTTVSTTTVAPTTKPSPAPSPTPQPMPSPGPAPAPGPPPNLAPVIGQWKPIIGPDLITTIRLQIGGSFYDMMRISRSAHLKFYPSGAMTPSDSANAIAAFNGGFNPADAGGQTSFSGVPGMAAVVGYTDGTFGLGQWGRDVPNAGKQVAWARSNLSLLVDGGAATPETGNPGLWGTPLSSIGMYTARSALGVDRDGNLLYVGTGASYPAELAQAIVAGGAVRAMELDINPWWVRAFVYPGGQSIELTQNPNEPGDHFRGGWNRDFFVATKP